VFRRNDEQKYFIGFSDSFTSLKPKEFDLSVSNFSKYRTAQEFELFIDNYEKTLATIKRVEQLPG
jgi:hypothetical protein